MLGAWGARAGITGPLFSPNVKVWADGAFYHEEEDGGEDEADFFAFAVGGAWTPAPGLSIGPEFAFNSWDIDDGAADGIGDEVHDGLALPGPRWSRYHGELATKDLLHRCDLILVARKRQNRRNVNLGTCT